MKAEIPDTLRQNLMQCGTWARPPSLLEKYMITAGLSHRDVLCIAPAGSGQTRAFLVPILHNMMVGLKDTKRKICSKEDMFSRHLGPLPNSRRRRRMPSSSVHAPAWFPLPMCMSPPPSKHHGTSARFGTWCGRADSNSCVTRRTETHVTH